VARGGKGVKAHIRFFAIIVVVGLLSFAAKEFLGVDIRPEFVLAAIALVRVLELEERK
jgi:hypothetical protein